MLSWGLDTGSEWRVLEGAFGTPGKRHEYWHLLHDATSPPAQAWLHAAPCVDLELGQLLFGESEQEGIAREVASVARTDLIMRLRGFFAGACASAELSLRAAHEAWLWQAFAAASERAWSGTLSFEICLDHQALQLVLGGDLVAILVPLAPAAVPPESPAVPLRDAMARQTVALRACLEEVELSLGSLRGLRSGDVLRLPHAVGQPLAVLGPSGTRVCHGWLGGSAGQRALQLAPAPDDASADQNQTTNRSKS